MDKNIYKSRGGVYYNLKKSEYTLSTNSGIKFFFSSKFYMEKFEKNYMYKREENKSRIKSMFKNEVPIEQLSDISYYIDVEKRGFLVEIENFVYTEPNMINYCVMIE